ncbi:hypothetical protein GM50_1555 [freshwater metagenome]|uniref:Uncharacterized protein n=1 Tax=freshwater metagenome TaxID=449393 RepID=A0A094QDW1_9ZZZZ
MIGSLNPNRLMATITPKTAPQNNERAIEVLTRRKVGATFVHNPSDTGLPFKAVPRLKSPENIDFITSPYHPRNLSGMDSFNLNLRVAFKSRYSTLGARDNRISANGSPKLAAKA